MASTGLLFEYEVSIPDRSKMQMVEFRVISPFTADANVVTMNVDTVALVGKALNRRWSNTWSTTRESQRDALRKGRRGWRRWLASKQSDGSFRRPPA